MGQLPTDTVIRLLKVIPGLMLEDGDARPSLPPIFSMAVQVPFELLPGGPGSLARSALFDLQFTIAASTAAQDTDTNTISAGLWLFDYSIEMVANFASGLARLSFVRGSDTALMRLEALQLLVANESYVRRRTMTVLFREDHFFRVSTPATGVGQNVQVTGTIYAARLL